MREAAFQVDSCPNMELADLLQELTKHYEERTKEDENERHATGSRCKPNYTGFFYQREKTFAQKRPFCLDSLPAR